MQFEFCFVDLSPACVKNYIPERGSKYYEFSSSLQIDKLVSIRIYDEIYRKFYTAIRIFPSSNLDSIVERRQSCKLITIIVIVNIS